MNIYLDNVNFSSSSGPNSFGKKLAKNLISRGHELNCNDPNDIDVILTFIMTSLNTKFRPMVQRLDGIYFNSAQDYQSLNSPIRMTYEMSSAVIYQSDFNKKLTEHYFGKHSNPHVIRNGTNFDEISKILPLKHRVIDKFEEVWSCASSWRPHKRLSENIRYFLENASENTCLIIAGDNPDIKIEHPRIFYVGPLDWMTLISMYKRSKKFLHLAWLDHCPNVVVDAKASGCEIVCSSAGGTIEIAGKNATIIEEDEWDFSPIRLYSPPALDFSRSINDNIFDSDLNIDTVASHYLDVLNEVIK
ncbi:glycosyltransferase [bacterium]|nr:glycosyltransferase [bacterium]